MKKTNRPPKGSIVKVDPIRDPEIIEMIKKLLANEPRNRLLFILGINTNLRMCDILALKFGQVRGLIPGDILILREKKTDKIRRISVNSAVWKALQPWLALNEDKSDDKPVFYSMKTGRALTVPSVNYLIKSWCKSVDLKGRYGCHTLRKTFGFQHRTRFGTDLPTLMVMYNHSNQRQTLDYLGIMEDDLVSAYMCEI